MDLCHWLTEYPQLIIIILFRDEACFVWDGVNNMQNAFMWSAIYPYMVRKCYFQITLSVNIWHSFLHGTMLTGLLIFDHNLIESIYYEMFLRYEWGAHGSIAG
jgi:hypothetical protein